MVTCPTGVHQEAPARARTAAQNLDVTIAGKRWPSTRAWRSGSTSECSLSPTGCCASMCRRARTCRGTRNRVEHHRPSLEYAPERMSELRHAPGSLYAPASLFTRCTWNLKPLIEYPLETVDRVSLWLLKLSFVSYRSLWVCSTIGPLDALLIGIRANGREPSSPPVKKGPVPFGPGPRASESRQGFTDMGKD